MEEKSTENTLIKNMLDKSQEAFLLAIEIYNKPTIQYRLEGFSFFICNAWELLLKAYLIKTVGSKSIYYKDKTDRTIALSDCIKKVFTNNKDPIRKNLEIIIELRNTSTHYIIKELEPLYISFLQACVINYSQKLFDYFSLDVTEKINSSFMSLITNVQEFDDSKILGKYGDAIFSKYKKIEQEASEILEETSNDKLAIKINVTAQIVKNSKDAQLTFSLAKDGEQPIAIVKEIKDINSSFPYNQKKAIATINSILKKRSIEHCLNQYEFQNICKFYNLYDDPQYFYIIQLYEKTSPKKCSYKVIEFISNLLIDDITCIERIIKENKKRQLTLGAKEF